MVDDGRKGALKHGAGWTPENGVSQWTEVDVGVPSRKSIPQNWG